jgi:molybdopterin-guanine dinucleotide biosynthesis protein A
MQRHPQQQLLLCPVDMPQLNRTALITLLTAAAQQPGVPCVAHDGQRCQPLLGLYPNTAPQRAQLNRLIERGERRLQTWLAQQPLQTVPLDPAAIQNINHATEFTA